jgi:hypothetical protein
MGWMVNVTPRALYPRGRVPALIVREVGWAPGSVWTDVENLAPAGIRFPDRPAPSESLYRLSYPCPRRAGGRGRRERGVEMLLVLYRGCNGNVSNLCAPWHRLSTLVTCSEKELRCLAEPFFFVFCLTFPFIPKSNSRFHFFLSKFILFPFLMSSPCLLLPFSFCSRFTLLPVSCVFSQLFRPERYFAPL